jgi:hypothetical protein
VNGDLVQMGGNCRCHHGALSLHLSIQGASDRLIN